VAASTILRPDPSDEFAARLHPHSDIARTNHRSFFENSTSEAILAGFHPDNINARRGHCKNIARTESASDSSNRFRLPETRFGPALIFFESAETDRLVRQAFVGPVLKAAAGGVSGFADVRCCIVAGHSNYPRIASSPLRRAVVVPASAGVCSQ